jgi:hypothetical protein
MDNINSFTLILTFMSRTAYLIISTAFIMALNGADKPKNETDPPKHLKSLMVELSDCQIREFKVSETTISAAVEKAFAMAGSQLKYLTGFKIDPDVSGRKITISVNSIDFGVLLRMIADQATVSIHEDGGVVYFKKPGTKQPSVLVIPIKQVTAKKLGLGASGSAKDALNKFGFDPLSCYFSIKTSTLVFKSDDDEIQILKAAILLLERGYKIALN